MANYDYRFIGHDLDSVIETIGNDKKIAVEITQTRFKDKIEERMNNKPIVIRQKEGNGTIILTITYFK